MRLRLLWAILVSTLLFVAAVQAAAPQKRLKPADAIRTADQEWAMAFGAKNLEESSAFCAEDGSVLEPNPPIAAGREAIRRLFSTYFSLPGLNVSRHPIKIDVARSGDLGYSTGTYEVTFGEPSRKLMQDKGKYVTVWKNQNDGSWKVLLDIFNTDLPVAKPPSVSATPTTSSGNAASESVQGGHASVFTVADIINLVIALGTIAAAIFAALSARYAGASARDAANQMELSRNEMVLHREQLHAETFLSVLSYERGIRFSKNMDVIRGLGNKAFAELNEQERTSIRIVVDFLNHIAHLIRYRYVKSQQMLLLYTPSIEECQKRLIGKGKWLQEMRNRANNNKLYLHFEALCRDDTRDKIWKGEIEEAFTKDIYQPPPVLKT